MTHEARQADVAHAAGVNRATVSRALDPARQYLIASETVTRIQRIADDLGYRPNALARGLKTRRSGIVALVIAAELVPFAQTALLRAVDEALAQSGYFTLVIHAPEISSVEQHPVISKTRGLIDGAILVTTNDRAVSIPSSSATIPLVTLGFAPALRTNIVLDEAKAVELALRHLVRLGHSRIALISEPAGTSRGDAFLETYRRTYRSFFGEVDEGLVESFQPSRPTSARDACGALFHRGADPTAIVATDDTAAMACYGAVRHFGISVGLDISVVGMGNSPPTAFLDPPLTTVAMPLHAASAASAEALLRQIDKRVRGVARTRPKVFEPYLVQRMSSTKRARA